MALPIPASEVVVGDYSDEYGTVKQVKRTKDAVEITFKNGTVVNRNKDDEITMTQGGRY